VGAAAVAGGVEMPLAMLVSGAGEAMVSGGKCGMRVESLSRLWWSCAHRHVVLARLWHSVKLAVGLSLG
jgi:hypothetical protein